MKSQNVCRHLESFTSGFSDPTNGRQNGEKYNKGAIHWTKISGNSGTKSNGTERFWKLISKILDNLQRLSLFSGNLEIPGISCSIGHYHSVSSSSRPKRWRRQVFSPAIRMFLRFTRHRIILMTHFNVSDATTRFVQFLEEKFLDLVKCNVT